MRRPQAQQLSTHKNPLQSAVGHKLSTKHLTSFADYDGIEIVGGVTVSCLPESGTVGVAVKESGNYLLYQLYLLLGPNCCRAKDITLAKDHGL